MNIEKIAQHEAAHGIVWYLFRDNWKVNLLTIDKNSLSVEGMDGTLHITSNFINAEVSVDREIELFAIALAGLIGQNLKLILDRPDIRYEIMRNGDFNNFLDTTGCSGDFELARKVLPYLGNEFRIDEGAFTKYKIMDLIELFQDHDMVQTLHAQLSQMLLERGTLSREELINFFDNYNFSEYIEDNNLDINFFH